MNVRRLKTIGCIVVFAATLVISSTAEPAKLQSEGGLQNVYRLSPRIYSGSAPESAADFQHLKELGIRTVLSVDGAKPNVEGAHKCGLQYVHLPFGYDGISSNQVVRLAKAAAELPKPIFVHCHHGLHRGPAAAAIMCEASEQWTAAQSVQWLHEAGTSTNYPGLYHAVASFNMPSAEALASSRSDFVEVSETSAWVDSMVQIDERFDHLKLLQTNSFKPLTAHPDLTAVQEALQLEELLKELLRNNTTNTGADFRAKLAAATDKATQTRILLSQESASVAEVTTCLEEVRQSCVNCHAQYRNAVRD